MHPQYQAYTFRAFLLILCCVVKICRPQTKAWGAGFLAVAWPSEGGVLSLSKAPEASVQHVYAFWLLWCLSQALGGFKRVARGLSSVQRLHPVNARPVGQVI